MDALLPDGTRVVGSVALRLGGEAGQRTGPAELYYSRFKPTHRVAAWLDLMALVATDPSRPWRALSVSRPDRAGADPTVNDLVPDTSGVTPAGAEALAVAVDCYRRGMTEPLPLFPNFSYQLYRGEVGSRVAGGASSSPRTETNRLCGWPSTIGTSTASPD